MPLADDQRWVPGLADDDAPIVIPFGWRHVVAGWPHERWARWKTRVAELAPPGSTADEIRAADRAAFLELAGRRPP